jgi:trimeric autotransporter adhesin
MSRRAGNGLVVAVMVAVGGLVLSPSTALAASSGGWNNLGPAGAGNPDYGSIEGKVIVLERSGSDLYVGGNFNDAGGVEAADRIAKWNGSAWSAVCPTLTGDGPTGDVYSIAVDPQNGRVYAGGSFQNVGPDLADVLAVCRNGAWHSLGGVSFLSNVTALEIVGRTMYVGGGFLNGAGIAEADYVVAYDLDGGGFFAITNDSGDFSSGPNDIEADGAGSVYMAGNFINVDGILEADFVVHYDGSQHWSALGSGPGPDHGAIPTQGGQVRGLAVAANGDVYAVGDFINVNGTGGAGDKIAKWDGASWSAVGAGSFFGEGGLSLRDVVVEGPRVFVVGSFSNAGGQVKVDGIAAFNGTSWTNVGTNAAGTDGPVTGPSPLLYDLVTIGARLYIGGLDQDIGGGVLNDAIAFYRLRQPDGEIRTSSSFVGNGIYNTTAKNQTRSLTVNRGSTGTFTLRIGNDGFATDSLTVKGPGSGGGFSAT